MQRQFDLPANGELHIAVPLGDGEGGQCSSARATLRSIEGDAGRTSEICGAEMVAETPIVLESGTELSIYTTTGCSILLEGPPVVLAEAYVDTLDAAFHRSILDIHYALLKQRTRAKVEERVGPCVLVCGTSSDSGKSSIARTMANYTARMGGAYHPMYLDLDTANPSVGVPNCISVYNMQYTIDDDCRAMSVPGQHIYVGQGRNAGMFCNGVKYAMDLTFNRWAKSDRAMLGGLFADYPTIDVAEVEESERAAHHTASRELTMPKGPLEVLRYTIEQCNVDTLVIVGSSWLKHKLLAAYDVGGRAESHSVMTLESGQEVTLIVLEQPQGAAPRSDAVREALAARFWEHYFYGTQLSPLVPSEVELDMEHVWLLRIMVGGDDDALQTMLSIDHAESEVAVVRLMPNDLKQGAVLALSDTCFALCTGPNPHHVDATFAAVDEETVYQNMRASRRVLGFVKVVSTTRTSVTVLSPCAVLPQPTGCCFIACDED